MVVTFPTYTAAGEVLLKPYETAKPACTQTHEAYLDCLTVLLE